jgi:RNA recognition motif-containing protein
MNNKLFVGNLSFNTTENDLQDAFAAHGTVVEANLMVDRMSGRPAALALSPCPRPKRPRRPLKP